MGSQRGYKPDAALQRKFYAITIAIFVVFILPWALLGLIPGLGVTYVWIYLLANLILLVPIFLLIPPYFRSIEYSLGEDEIVVIKGIITKTVQTVPYRTVTNIDVKRGPFDRWLSIGSVAIHTAGYSQQTSAEATLSGLREYAQVQEEILRSLRSHRARAGAPGDGEQPVEQGAELAGLLQDVRADLRAVRERLETAGRV